MEPKAETASMWPRQSEEIAAGSDTQHRSDGSSVHDANGGQNDSLASGHQGSTGVTQADMRDERMLNV